MIEQLYNFRLQAPANNNAILNNQFNFNFNIDDSVPRDKLNQISITSLQIPTTVYTNQTQTQITIDGNNINILQGTFGFTSLISYLSLQLGVNYNVQSYNPSLASGFSKGWLQINRIDNASFTFTIPQSIQRFFGYPTLQLIGSDYMLLSTQICDFTQNTVMQIICDGIKNEYMPGQKQGQILYQFSIDYTQGFSVYQEVNIPITQNRFIYNQGVKNLQFKVIDQTGNNVIFQSSQYLYIGFCLFNYDMTVYDKIYVEMLKNNKLLYILDKHMIEIEQDILEELMRKRQQKEAKKQQQISIDKQNLQKIDQNTNEMISKQAIINTQIQGMIEAPNQSLVI